MFHSALPRRVKSTKVDDKRGREQKTPSVIRSVTSAHFFISPSPSLRTSFGRKFGKCTELDRVNQGVAGGVQFWVASLP